MRERKPAGRITAAVLAACMAFTLFPAAAFADAAELDTDQGLRADGSIAISKANFPDDNFRKYISDTFDAGVNSITVESGKTFTFTSDKAHDGCLTKHELNDTITHIYCADLGIESLEGIQYFTALDWLNCENNELKNESMDCLKANTKLRGLQCAGNLITELDVSGFDNLETLGCIGRRTRLQKLKVDPNLHVLYCYNNNIAELDVSQCTQLTELNCDNNPRLGTLDVSNCTELLHLFCQNTGLTALDVSRNAKLETLRCNHNDFSESGLDVTQNPALKELYCSNIRITSLDLSGNPVLMRLNVSDNQLTSLSLTEGQISGSDPQWTYGNNEYQIVVGTARTFDLNTLPGRFEVSRAGGWSGGTADADGILTVNPGVDEVTYNYDCGADRTAAFTLLVHTHVFGGWLYEDENRHKHLCKDDGSTETEEHTYGADGVTCTECGYVKTGSNWEWKSNDTEHWLEYTDADGNQQTTQASQHDLVIKPAAVQGQLDKLVCTCGHGYVGAAVHAANFPDETFRAFIADGFDTDGNRFITSTELAAISKIDCSGNRNIKSLRGIEYFTALTELRCNNNDLSASGLDVSALKELEVLVIDNCGLTELDLSRNTQLKDLSGSNNKLTELNLRNCTGLKWLWFRNNLLTELDLTGLNDLIDVAVDNNQLTELDVSDKAALNKLGFSNNQLTSMNLGIANPKDAPTGLWSCADNSYSITVDTSRKFQLSSLPGSFDVEKADGWAGGTVDKTIGVLTVEGTDPTAVVTYDYDCGHGRTAHFTLNVTVHDHTFGAWQHDSVMHWHTCTDAACPSENGRLDEAAHVYDDDADTICKVCGYDRTQPPVEPEPAASFQPGRDVGGALATAIVAGTAAWGSYEVATRLILHSILPEGTKIPTARIQLAALVWENAGRPEPAAQPAFEDVADPDEAKAAQWCVEQGLLDARSAGTFGPDGWVPKYKTIAVWNKAKEKGLLGCA